ncbi:MAG: hypothetical protein ACYDH6_19940 [Acidimicrobiales bacterium]
MAPKPPDYPTWKGHEDIVEEGLEQAGLNVEPQPQGFGERPDFAVCTQDGERLCFVEVKSGAFADKEQALAHLEAATQSEWGELHYFTPDGTDANFSPAVRDVLAAAGDRVVFHPIADSVEFNNHVSELANRADAMEGEAPAELGAEPVASLDALDAASETTEHLAEGADAGTAVTEGVVDTAIDVVDVVADAVTKATEL